MITIELKDDVAQAAFRRLADALADMTPAMKEIGEMLVSSTQDRMTKGVTPEGTPFAPRSQTTLDLYAAKTPPMVPRGGPLNLTGTLIGGIFHSAGADEVLVASNAIQAAVMQFGAGRGSLGGGAPWGDIPARPFLGLSETDRDGIVETVAEWLESLT